MYDVKDGTMSRDNYVKDNTQLYGQLRQTVKVDDVGHDTALVAFIAPVLKNPKMSVGVIAAFAMLAFSWAYNDYRKLSKEEQQKKCKQGAYLESGIIGCVLLIVIMAAISYANAYSHGVDGHPRSDGSTLPPAYSHGVDGHPRSDGSTLPPFDPTKTG